MDWIGNFFKYSIVQAVVVLVVGLVVVVVVVLVVVASPLLLLAFSPYFWRRVQERMLYPPPCSFSSLDSGRWSGFESNNFFNSTVQVIVC